LAGKTLRAESIVSLQSLDNDRGEVVPLPGPFRETFNRAQLLDYSRGAAITRLIVIGRPFRERLGIESMRFLIPMLLTTRQTPDARHAAE